MHEIVLIASFALFIGGLGWGCSMFERKSSLAELLAFTAYWATSVATVRWLAAPFA